MADQSRAATIHSATAHGRARREPRRQIAAKGHAQTVTKTVVKSRHLAATVVLGGREQARLDRVAKQREQDQPGRSPRAQRKPTR
jgi:hypothetical protein